MGGVPGGIWELFWALFRCSSWEAFRRPLWGRNSALWEAKLGAEIKQKRRRVGQKSTFRPSASELVWGAVPEPFGHHFRPPNGSQIAPRRASETAPKRRPEKEPPKSPKWSPRPPQEPPQNRPRDGQFLRATGIFEKVKSKTPPGPLREPSERPPGPPEAPPRRPRDPSNKAPGPPK